MVRLLYYLQSCFVFLDQQRFVLVSQILLMVFSIFSFVQFYIYKLYYIIIIIIVCRNYNNGKIKMKEKNSIGYYESRSREQK